MNNPIIIAIIPCVMAAVSCFALGYRTVIKHHFVHTSIMLGYGIVALGAIYLNACLLRAGGNGSSLVILGIIACLATCFAAFLAGRKKAKAKISKM
jgi:hypothetical protein